MIFQQGGLAAAGRAHDGDELAGLDAQVDVLQHVAFGLRVAEAHVTEFELAPDGRGIGQRLCGRRSPTGSARYRRCVPGAGRADGTRSPFRPGPRLSPLKLVLYSHEGEDHADRNDVVDSEHRGKIDRYDMIDPENDAVHRGELDMHPAQANLGVHALRVAVRPAATFAVTLAIEQLDCLDGPRSLDEGGVGIGVGAQALLAVPVEPAVLRDAHDHIQQQRHHGDQGQLDAVDRASLPGSPAPSIRRWQTAQAPRQ